ncbi:hypothetical protein CPC08DRAFT_658499 [Agrocybe pediades]|nr:hypothetical protein CPC08DRAFT_658499 [Agrocybe pediades]
MPEIDAESPFHPEARGADAILRSCDNIRFYVVKAFLIYASPVFQDMFSVPKSPDDARDEEAHRLPIIDMAEESKFLRPLLLLCYPRQRPNLGDFDSIANTAIIAQKYCMDDIEEELVSLMKTTLDLVEDPLRVFDLSLRHDWEALGREAAKASLRHKAADLPMPSNEAYMSGMDVCRVFQYRYNCARAIRDWVRVNINNYKCLKYDGDRDCYMMEEAYCWWPLPGETLQSEGHSPRMEHACEFGTVWTPTSLLQKGEKPLNISGRRWWIRSFLSLLEQLDSRPCSETIVDWQRLIDSTVRTLDCDICASVARDDLQTFLKRLAASVDTVISEVPLDVKWPSMSTTTSSD